MTAARKILRSFLLLALLLAPALAASAGQISLAEAQRQLRTEAEDANVLFSLSFYFERVGRPFSAMRAVERAIEVDKKVPGYHARYGQLLLSRRRIREAAAAYGRAADMDPKAKAFRAAEARALTSCDLLKRAAASWKQLLDGTEERKEVLDSALQLAAVHRQMNTLAGAENAWLVAVGKLDDWSDRVKAADRAARVMVARGAPDRAVKFWAGLFKKETDWKRRADIAGRLSRVAMSPSKRPARLLAEAARAWKKLLDTGAGTPEKQRAAVALAGVLLADSKPEKAVVTLRPWLFAHEWNSNFGAGEVLHRAYTRLGKAPEREKLWREFIKRSGNYGERSKAVGRLAAILDDKAALLALHRETVKDYPSQINAHRNLAGTLESAGRLMQAVEVYGRILPLVKRQKYYRVYNEYRYWSSMVSLSCRAGKPERALEFMQNRFAAVADPWQVNNWLSSFRSYCGEYAALNAAGKLAETKGVRRLGAGLFLTGYLGRREAARPVLWAAADDAGLKRSHRQQALNSLMGIARTGGERVKIARRMVDLGGEYWARRQSYQTLTRWLVREGRVKEAVAVVRQADRLRRNKSSAGPNVLYYLGRYLFDGNRVGLGLRTPAGLAEAEEAALGLYRDFAENRPYYSYFGSMLGNLAELHARRGDYAGAVDFMHKACKVRDAGFLRLKAAELLDRKSAEDKSAALKEHMAYVDVIARYHAVDLRKRQGKRYSYSLPSIDGRFPAFLKKHDKDAEFLKYADARMEKIEGLEREAVAQFVLQFYWQRARPEDVKKLIAKVRGWGAKNRLYRYQDQQADAAIKMKNSKSQADTRRRDRLHKEVDRWKRVLARNSEDYQAALNVYKVYLLLGLKKDGDPYMKKGLEVGPKDPLVMERYARELMLVKRYAGAARMLAQAAEITGRRTDYEVQMVSAFALSGKGKDALELALDSLVQGRHGGRGVRTVEQILDMAHRANQGKFLQGELKKLFKAKKPMRDEVVRLALRVAWDAGDAELSKAAVDELVRIIRDPSRYWRDQWRLSRLAQKARERRRLEDSARIRGAILELRASQGYSANVHEYRQLAMLLVEAGKVDHAAGRMFDGLSRAGQGRARQQLRPKPWNWGRRRHFAPVPEGLAMVGRQVRLPWISAILGMAAQEASSGGGEFGKACGKRLAALVAGEMKELEKSPALYRGPLTNANIEEGLGLRGKVTTAFRAAAKAKQATGRDHLALAGRLVNLAALPPEKRPKGLKLEEITASCQAAIKAAGEDEVGKANLDVARLYRRLLSVKEKQRLAGLKAETALTHYEAAAAARSGRWGLDALREALQLARAHKLAAKELAYARRLSKAFSDDAAMRRTLADALLRAGKVEPALAMLRVGLGDESAYNEYEAVGDACMRKYGEEPVAPRAAAGAVDFYKEAISIYLREVGKQVDAKGKPLPDRGLGYLQSKLSKAYAAEGSPEKALEGLVASVFNRGGDALDVANVELVAEAYLKAGKSEKLLVALAAKVKAKPKDFKLRLAHAAALAKCKKFSEAAAALRAAKALKSELATVRTLIEVLRKAGLHREALAECKAWAASFPRDAAVYRAMAGVYKDLKDKQGELRALTMLVEVAPREAANCRQVAVLFAERKEFDRAISLFERAMELRPEEPYRHIDLAEALFLAEKYERAGKLCRKALERDWTKGLAPELMARMPDWRGTYETRAHSLLGDIYEKQKEKGKATKARLNVPPGYKRPALKDAVPRPRRRGWWPRPMAWRRGGRRIIER